MKPPFRENRDFVLKGKNHSLPIISFLELALQNIALGMESPSPGQLYYVKLHKKPIGLHCNLYAITTKQPANKSMAIFPAPR